MTSQDEGKTISDILRSDAASSEAPDSQASDETVLDPQHVSAGQAAAITVLDVNSLIHSEPAESAKEHGLVSLPADYLAKLDAALDKLYPQYTEKLKDFIDRRHLDQELCGHGIFSETDIMQAYATASGLSVLDEEELNDLGRFEFVAYDFLAKWCCVPYQWNEKFIHLLVADPYVVDRLSYMFERMYGLKARFALGRRSNIERIVHATYSPESIEAKAKDDIILDEFGNASEETLRNMASEAKIVRLVTEMLSRACELNASDIHIEPEEKELNIRFRIDGNLQEAMNPPLSLFPAIASRIKLIGGLNIAERRLPQDGRTNTQIGRSNIDIRISTMPSMSGESIVLRLLNKESMVFDLKNVGMLDVMREEFEKIVQLPHGIVLVVGPTGSGKSTTLYSAMSKINTPDKKIITIEDPVEYRTAGLTQIQVNAKIGLDFANGLRSIVRQDPDVILVGEIRDRETAEIAIHAALTGHLVLSTLHTNDAPGAVSRLLDMGVDGFLISSSLVAVLSQRLVRKICTQCGGAATDAAGVRCKRCNGSGYKGRVGIFELMAINDEIRSLVSAKADSVTLAEAARRNGMGSLVEDGLEKAKSGITTEAEVYSVAMNV